MKEFDIYDQLTFEFFRMSKGNPYIIQDLVQSRNYRRALEKENISDREL